MGLFDALETDFEDVAEFSPGVPAGTYEAMVSAVETEQKDSGLYLVLTYTVTDGDQKGKTHKEFQRMVTGRASTKEEIRSLQFIKTRLLSLGIPPERQNSVEPDDIVGAEVALTLVDQKNNPQYRNVAKVVLLTGDAGPSLPTAKKPDEKVAEPVEESDGMFD